MNTQLIDWANSHPILFITIVQHLPTLSQVEQVIQETSTIIVFMEIIRPTNLLMPMKLLQIRYLSIPEVVALV